MISISRNDPCPCGSGRKYKRCCLPKDKAQAAFGKAVGHYNLGIALREQGQPALAAENFRRALEIDPGLAQAYNNLGAALQELGELKQSTAAFRRALALDPAFAEAHFNLHALLLDADNLEPALGHLRRAVELRPQEPGFRFFLGLLLDYGGNADAAAIHFDFAAAQGGAYTSLLDGWRHVQASSGPGRPRLIGSSIEAFRIGLSAATIEGLVLEFGVHYGTSIRQIAACAGGPVHGFDSFQGLPEDWHGEPRGSYSTGGVLPEVPENVVLHAGWFENSIPEFNRRHREPLRFVNVDCDLYSSTRTVLDLLAERVVPGTVMVFDEYLGHEHWREDEHRAFTEAAARWHWRHEILAFSFSTRQLVLRIR